MAKEKKEKIGREIVPQEKMAQEPSPQETSSQELASQKIAPSKVPFSVVSHSFPCFFLSLIINYALLDQQVRANRSLDEEAQIHDFIDRHPFVFQFCLLLDLLCRIALVVGLGFVLYLVAVKLFS